MATIFGHKWDSGNGLKFDGVNDYIEVSKVFALADIRTVSFWMKASTVNASSTIVSFGTTGNNNAYAWAYITVSFNLLVFGYSALNGSPYTRCNISDNLIDGNLHHIVCIFSGNRINNDITGFKCYVDGILKIVTNISVVGGSLPTIQGVSKIGGYPGASGVVRAFYKNYLFDLKVFNKELSQTEITELYTKQGQIVPSTAMSSLQLDYRFNNKSSTVLTDKSINGYHGTLMNYAIETTDLGATNSWCDKYGNALTAY